MTPKSKQIKLNLGKFSSIIKYPLSSSVLIVGLFFSNLLLADGQHSHEEIQIAATEFVRSQVPEDITIKRIVAGDIDPRIKFKQCSQELDIQSTMNKRISKSWTIGVRCNDDVPWSIYIPVKTKLMRKMLVSTTTITRGELITSNKLKLVELEITHQNQKHFSDVANVIGREARRTINPNRVINSSMLQRALLVRKKESVLIYAQNKNIRISMQGTALKNGHQNEMIKVRNNSSKKIIEALVIDRGIVAVNF